MDKMEEESKLDESTRSGHTYDCIKDERDLRQKAMKLDLAPLLGKAFRYVNVNKNGECEEVDEDFVVKKRASYLLQQSTGTAIKRFPFKRFKKVRHPPFSSMKQVCAENEDIPVDCTTPGWLPESFVMTRVTKTHITGWIQTEEELKQVLAAHTEAFSCKFISCYKGRKLTNTDDPKRIAWKREDIEPDCPFAIDSYLVRHCPFGSQQKRLAYVKKKYSQIKTNCDDKDAIACDAKLKIRRVTLYDDFQLHPTKRTKKEMWCKMLNVKRLVNAGGEVKTSTRIYLQLPLPAAHKNHDVCKSGMETEQISDNECLERFLAMDPLDLRESLAKSESQEVKDDGHTVEEGAFQSVDLGDQWRLDPSLLLNAVNSALISEEVEQDIKRIKREKASELPFEVRPPYKRSHILSSCKVDCPARIKIKRVTLYDKFKLQPGASRRQKDDKMIMLKDLIANSFDSLEVTPAVFMQLPLAAAHRNHQVSIPFEAQQYTLRTGRHDESELHQALCSWLPPSFKVVSLDMEYVTGWVSNEQDYMAVLENHRTAFNCSFLSRSNDKERTFKAESDRRLVWKKDFIDPGCPFTINHSLVLTCAFSFHNSRGAAQQTVSDQEQLQTNPNFLVETESLVDSSSKMPSPPQLDVSSLEIEYYNDANLYPELQSFVKPNETYETYIIYVEDS